VDDFENFNEDAFVKATLVLLRNMHAFLRQAGVYMPPKLRRPSYANIFFDLVQEEQ
jgi:hypothetical protein